MTDKGQRYLLLIVGYWFKDSDDATCLRRLNSLGPLSCPWTATLCLKAYTLYHYPYALRRALIPIFRLPHSDFRIFETLLQFIQPGTPGKPLQFQFIQDTAAFDIVKRIAGPVHQQRIIGRDCDADRLIG